MSALKILSKYFFAKNFFFLILESWRVETTGYIIEVRLCFIKIKNEKNNTFTRLHANYLNEK